MKRQLAAALIASTFLTACQQPGMNTYGFQDVGQASKVTFGTIIASREVDIQRKNNGVGTLAGATGGAIAGASFGNGNGQLGAALAGALIAGIAGHAIEQGIADHKGIEYTIAMETGDTVTIVQNKEEGEQPMKPGQPVMIQENGQYKRVLPTDHLPSKVKKPKRVKVEK